MIAVIGAGPSGLALAWQLAEAGHRAVVLEAGHRIGGTAASIDVAGIRVDLGQHRLHPEMGPGVRRAIEQVVELELRRRRDRVHVGGRWVPLPPNPRIATLRAVARPAAWRRAGEACAWKEWGTDPRRTVGVPEHWPSPPSPASAVVAGLARDARHRTFLYPRRGFGALVEAMAERVPEIRTGTRVTGLLEHHDRVIVGLADGRIVTASHVLSTVSAVRTAGWLGLPAPAPPPMRAVVLVYLTVPRRPYTPYDAHHLPQRAVLPIRLSEPANHRNNPADPADRTVLCAEIPCWEGDEIWHASDAELGLRVADDLVRCGLPDPAAVGSTTVRLARTRAVMTPADLGQAAALDRALDASRRVTALGSHDLGTTAGTHQLLDLGFAAARCFDAAGGFDHARWRGERARVHGLVPEGEAEPGDPRRIRRGRRRAG